MIQCVFSSKKRIIALSMKKSWYVNDIGWFKKIFVANHTLTVYKGTHTKPYRKNNEKCVFDKFSRLDQSDIFWSLCGEMWLPKPKNTFQNWLMKIKKNKTPCRHTQFSLVLVNMPMSWNKRMVSELTSKPYLFVSYVDYHFW